GTSATGPSAIGGRTPGLKFSIALAVAEASVLMIAIGTALSVFRSLGGLGAASWVVVIGLPLFNAMILSRRQFYTSNHLLFAALQPARLASAWIGAFGLSVLLATLVRCVEPVRLHNLGLFPPEMAAIFGVGLATLLTARLAWMMIRPRYAARAIPRVLFVGALDSSRRLLTQLRRETTIHLVSAIDYRDHVSGDAGDRSAPAGGETRISDPSHLKSRLQHENIDAILLALPQLPEADIATITAAAQSCGVTTVALPGQSLRRNLAAGLTALGGVPVLRRDTAAMARRAMAQKRLVDLILGSVVLIIIAPVMAIIAVLIRLESPGPVLFRQIRVGRGGALFEILKFRTMIHAPAATSAELELQTQRNDRRVTRFGAVLRRHSLDELPQIFNVLRGDMSIIGPRPHAAAMMVEGSALETLVPDYGERFAVRPGITGWAQINGSRGIIDSVAELQDRVDHDLYYIENWSLGFDMSILLRTVMCVICDDQAF
ncbi:exopolysaccharide biosynthesis polyprenyl glycosylphosphotransferase, partial [Acidiphilium sp.]|uniref:exopolysaccharide biosynthesis polyprenyl glycosylphosphotransferase n=1 Tax=Acidiphilium sp. TaxID=527 RepID=UPI003D0181F9